MALLFPLILVGAVYFLMLRPQQQRVARQRTLISSIDVGDEVVTAGGMLGHVRRMDDDRIWLEVAPGVEITMLRGAIAQRVTPPADSAIADEELSNGHVAEDDVPEGEDRGTEGFNGV